MHSLTERNIFTLETEQSEMVLNDLLYSLIFCVKSVHKFPYEEMKHTDKGSDHIINFPRELKTYIFFVC